MKEQGTTATIGSKSLGAMAEASWGEIDRANAIDAVPPGWKTAMGKAVDWGISAAAATGRLQDMVLAGRVESKSFRVVCPDSRIRLVKHFLPITPKK